MLVVLGVLAALSPAPIHTQHDSKAPRLPEASQSELAKEQALAASKGVMPEVGTVPINTSSEALHNSNAKSDDRATSIFHTAQKDMENSASKDEVAAVLRTAEQNVQSTKPSPLRSLFWFLVAGCLGYGVFFSFRRWADKNIPAPEDERPSKIR